MGLTEEELICIARYLFDNWADFQQHCREHGVDPDEIEEKIANE